MPLEGLLQKKLQIRLDQTDLLIKVLLLKDVQRCNSYGYPFYVYKLKTCQIYYILLRFSQSPSIVKNISELLLLVTHLSLSNCKFSALRNIGNKFLLYISSTFKKNLRSLLGASQYSLRHHKIARKFGSKIVCKTENEVR